MTKKVTKTDAEWQELLTAEQYRVTRKQGTERPFTGEYWNSKEEGVYRCICCSTPLFSSQEKFESSCGWPSFSGVMNGEAVREKEDRSFFMHRIEVVCDVCDAHLGHVFPDGPPPSGLRYCINSASLRLDVGDLPRANR